MEDDLFELPNNGPESTGVSDNYDTASPFHGYPSFMLMKCRTKENGAKNKKIN